MTTAWNRFAEKGEGGQRGAAGSTGASGTFARDNPGGRLTLVSGNPVPTSDVSGASAQTIYYTPYLSNVILLYDGSEWAPFAFSEASLSLGSAPNTQPWDVFGYLVSNVLTLELVAWSSNSARTTNIVQQNGVWVKSGDATKRFLGTLAMQNNGQSEDSVLRRYVFNQYNRVPRQLKVKEATTSWTYTTHTWRQANASTSNQVSVVNGAIASPAIAEIDVHLTLVATSSNGTANAAGIEREVSIGVDSTSAPHADCIYTSCGGGSGGTIQPRSHFATIDHMMALGKHDFTWLERAIASSTTTWFGSATPGGVNGLSGYVVL